MARSLIVFNREDVQIEHQGYKGRECLKTSEELFEALGTKRDEALIDVTPEFHQEANGQGEVQKQA